MKQGDLERRRDLLLFTSDALMVAEMSPEEPSLIIGRPKIVLFVRCDIEHFDVVARLCVVQGKDSFKFKLDVAELLVESDHDVNFEECNGLTPCDYCICSGFLGEEGVF